MGKFKVLCDRSCKLDSKVKQRALLFLHIFSPDVSCFSQLLNQ